MKHYMDAGPARFKLSAAGSVPGVPWAPHHPRGETMKICPIAIAVGCPKCVMFNVCPAKEALGGYKASAEAAPPVQAATKK
ncbi:MAG TPA: hypothetical protein VF386_00455 [Usitatibacter sp.]